MLYDGDTFEVAGVPFKFATEWDDSGDTPWECDEGTGIVSDWERRDKRSGERILCEDRGSRRFYDWRASIAKARDQGWGLDDASIAQLSRKLGRTPARGDIISEAVERDFQRLRGWCNDQWSYVGVIVTLLDDDGEETDQRESLWGIESDSGDYLEEVAQDLARDILYSVIVEGMARALFVSAWADAFESSGGKFPAGSDVAELAPEKLDPAAEPAARTLAMDLQRANDNTSLVRLFEQHPAGWTPRLWGHYAAMQATGHGVGLSDNMSCPVVVPYVEFGQHSLQRDYFNGER